ncbi:uncharacterized protein LOC141697582 isoform X2 [Apium graveolens]
MCSINNVKVNNAVDQRARNVVPGVEKSLEVGEVLVVDVSSIIALSGTVDVQIKFNSPMRRVVFGVISRWHEHWTSNKVYDRDMIVLQGQEKVFLSKSMEGFTDVNKEYTNILLLHPHKLIFWSWHSKI